MMLPPSQSVHLSSALRVLKAKLRRPFVCDAGRAVIHGDPRGQARGSGAPRWRSVLARHRCVRLAEFPQLAFSFKPRVGFSLDSLRHVSLEVLSAGFNIVELDTRNLPLDSKALDDLIRLACELPDKIRPHVGRLSLNLSWAIAGLLRV